MLESLEVKGHMICIFNFCSCGWIQVTLSQMVHYIRGYSYSKFVPRPS